MSSPQPAVTQPRSRRRISANKATSTPNLERIRNNQRRCRARRKEYIYSLESKIHELESINAESRMQKKLQAVVEENASLKRLLQSLGLRDEFLDKYHAAAARVASNSTTIMSLIPPLSPLPLSPPPPREGKQQCAQAKQCLSSLTALDRVQLPSGEDQHTAVSFPDTSVLEHEALDFSQTDASLPWDLIDFSAASASITSESVEANTHIEQFNHSTTNTFVTTKPRSSVDTDTEHVSDTTTLCSWAFSLVLKSNRKGYSAADLDLKLRLGYSHGATPTEGCRVDNKVLLSVLADIM